VLLLLCAATTAGADEGATEATTVAVEAAGGAVPASAISLGQPPPDVDEDPKAWWAWHHTHHRWAFTPSAKISYRSFVIPNLDGSDLRLHGGEVDIYALSYPYFRLGIDLELGGAKGTVRNNGQDMSTNAWFLLAGLSVGLQYPWRVTPFIDGRFIAGFLGGDVAGKNALTYLYAGGIDAGIEVYFWSHYYFSLAVGWIHPVYRGIDWTYQMANPMADPKFVTVQNDSFTFKIGIGM
jgi:hypothetical protein